MASRVLKEDIPHHLLWNDFFGGRNRLSWEIFWRIVAYFMAKYFVDGLSSIRLKVHISIIPYFYKKYKMYRGKSLI